MFKNATCQNERLHCADSSSGAAASVTLIVAPMISAVMFTLLFPSTSAAAWVYYTADNDQFRVDVTSSVGTLQKKQGSQYVPWITFGPVSRPPVMPVAGDPEAVTGIVENWGWLLLSDRYSIYKASYTAKTGAWNIARRVWNVGSGKIIDSMQKTTSGQVVVNWIDAHDANVTGAVTMSVSDISWPACNGGPVPAFFTDNNLVPGTSFYFRPSGIHPNLNTGIEFIPGTLPIIISAPHGGDQQPAQIPVFSTGLDKDSGSLAASKLLADAIESLTGERPHLVINNIRRNRLNLNVTAETDNQDPDAQVLWAGYHMFIDEASQYVTNVCGKGLFVDMHTNGATHDKNMLAIGFGRTDIDALYMGAYDRDVLVAKSTIRNLLSDTLMPVDNINIGPTLSFGDLVNRTSIHTIPNSVLNPMPSGTFYNGGYNIRRHGSTDGGSIDGIQIENHFKYINNGAQTREDYVTNDLAPAVIRWLEHYYGFKLR